MSRHVSLSQITHSLLICVIYFPQKNLCSESFSFPKLTQWLKSCKKKNVGKDSSYQIYFTEIDSWICNLKELTQPAKRLPLSAVKAMVSFHIRCDRWCDRCILLSFLPSETVQNLSDLYETCDRENAEIVGLLGRRSLSPRVSPSLSPVLSCAHCVLPGACYGG